MERYKNTRITTKKNNGTNSFLRTTLYSSVPKSDTDQYFIAQEGDRCDNLAHRFYGDTTLWWFIARVNNLTTNNIQAGTSLRIPQTLNNAKGL